MGPAVVRLAQKIQIPVVGYPRKTKHGISKVKAHMREIEVAVREREAPPARTGYPELDATIEDFLNEPMGDWTTDDAPVRELADACRSHGSCQQVADQFAEFAKARGFKAYATQTNMDEMGYKTTGKAAGEIMDDEGNIVSGFYYDHTVNEVYLPGMNFPITIDFTASQYGYKEMPKIS